MTEHELQKRDEELVQLPLSWGGLALKIIAGISVVIGSLVLLASVCLIGAWIGWLNNWWGWFAPPVTPSC